MSLSKMNKVELYELCKTLREENKKLQFDKNCLEEQNKDLLELRDCGKELNENSKKLQDQLMSVIKDQKDQINELKIMLDTKHNEIIEYVGKISYLSEHYDEWKNRNPFKHLSKNYNHEEYMKEQDIDPFRPTPQGNSD